jgi:hypothetical protein
MSETTPGVVSYVPPDAVARVAAATGGTLWIGRHRDSPPPFAGRPSGLVDSDSTPVDEPLAGMVDLAEAPAPDDAPAPSPAAVTVAAVRASLGAALVALDSIDFGPWRD